MIEEKNMKNYSSKFKANPNKEKWNEICPPMEYRLISGNEANSLGIVPSTMRDVNSVAIGASGSTENTILYFANYFRVDGTQIDQEPYFELYESGSTEPSLYGIFHHAKFNGRTETLTPDELTKIEASGSTADIKFIAKPINCSGSLDELREQGKIMGFEFVVKKVNKLKNPI